MKFKSLRYIAIIMLIVTVITAGELPYAYYILLRWVVCAASVITLGMAINEERTGWKVVFGILALLFNPLIPIHLDREIWLPIDILAALIFFISNFSIGRISKVQNLRQNWEVASTEEVESGEYEVIEE